jgi:ABC-type lipoprotein export system ATPase subunit
MVLIKLEKITLIFVKSNIRTRVKDQQVIALNNINLELEKNKIYVIFGVSGSGKSSLLNVLSTYILPTGGNFYLNGKEVYDYNFESIQGYRREKVGYLYQDFKLNFIQELSFYENIKLLNRHVSKDNLQEIFKIYNFKNKNIFDLPIMKLSGGEQQRLAFLSLIYKNPEILILDEPSSQLDEENKSILLKTIIEKKNEGKTIIISTHDPLFFEIADNVYILKEGKIEVNDIPKIIIENFDNSGLIVEGSKFLQNFTIPIPDKLSNLFLENTIVSFKEVEKDTKKEFKQFFVLQLNNDLFINADKDSWTIISNKSLQIPKLFQNNLKDSKRFFWQISNKGVILNFE